MTALPNINPAGAMTSRDDAQLKELGMISTRSKNGKMNEKEMREVANQFESMIFRVLMKEMRKTVPENKLIEQSHSMKMYQEIADDYMVDELTASNDLGIEGVIYNELVEINKNIVNPEDLQKHASEHKPIDKNKFVTTDTSTEDFIKLKQPHTDMLDIHAPQNWVDIPNQQPGFMNIENKHLIPTNKIDDGI